MARQEAFSGRNSHLKRLPPEYYRGQAYVHWTITTQDRKTGWLIPIFYYKFRELLTHTAFRFKLCCPIYCCMPDHIHLMWIGILDTSDQLLALRYFHRQLNPVLEKLAVKFQRETYDHVLKEDERAQSAFESVCDYVARNPERAGLVKEDRYSDYPFTDCLVPGYPELSVWEKDYWDRFWLIYAHLGRHRLADGAEVDE